jgi:4-methyl-5(b-hydroxyethyl)-thiazole monophosphate biosynthesis
MKKVLVLMAPGFEEIETLTVVDILRRAGARVTLAATEDGPIEGSRGVRVLPDALLEAVQSNDFDMVVLPGGQPGTNNLQQDSRVRALLQRMDKEHKKIAAICAAPMVLHQAGLLQGKAATCHPSVRDKLKGARLSEARVVEDGNITTSQAPGTAMEFALKLVEILFGNERLVVVNQGVLAKI